MWLLVYSPRRPATAVFPTQSAGRTAALDRVESSLSVAI